MLNKEILSVTTAIVLFIAFVVLLIVGAVFTSILTIIAAFVCGFVGYAIVDHESNADFSSAETNLNGE